MDMTRVRSSAIAAIGYDGLASRLRIQFTSGPQQYDFCRVPLDVYEAFTRAPSKGSFYQARIEGRYRC